MPTIIDGKAISAAIKDELKKEVAEKNIKAVLAVIQVGNDPASTVYVGNKKKACAYIGIGSRSFELPEETTEEELLKLIDDLNNDDEINGILVQLPVPKHIDEKKITAAISPDKDVDGFHPESVGRLCIGREGFVSCTPAGIIELLKRSNIEIEGKECVVIGRSNIVGKPMALLMLANNATVTVCHSRTKNMSEILKKADVVIVAVGNINFLQKDMIKDDAIVIDVGTNYVNGKVVGDVDFENVKDKAFAITPVPGGVGIVTNALLIENIIASAERMIENK